VILISANSFLSRISFERDERANAMVLAILSLAITLLLGILIYAYVSEPLQTQIDKTNNTELSELYDTINTLYIAAMGLLAVSIIVLAGLYMLSIMKNAGG
jgi:ABC-type Fe3+ transport system permease subunit